MLELRKSADRFHFQNEWLDTRWSFSFDHYYDPNHMSFGPLRVFNDDWIKPDSGFGLHPHRDMEIITYVLEGALTHQDDTGGAGDILAGEVQRMTAGTGIMHSEFNHSKTDPVHLLQIWVLPERRGLPPSYEQRPFSREQRTGVLLPVVAPEGRDGALGIHQDATVYISRLEPGQQVTHPLGTDRRAYLFAIDGAPMVNGQALGAGDAVKITGESQVTIAGGESGRAADMLLLDLPTFNPKH